MKGDFSSWRDERRQNFTGVLHQQGRVLLDADWNAQTAITNDWQDTAARDTIGAGVAAVPADQPDGFKVRTASVNANKVQLTVAPGRVWADGLLAELYGEPDPDLANDLTRIATYLTPPVQDPGFDVSTIANGKRDAVILEVWREEINGFQLPGLLVEPALGGPDTTERVHTSMAFRLMRLDPTDTCENIIGRLRDDFASKGKLKVTLQPPIPSGTPDCPTVAGGGYTGFEHNLYRIEIADVNAGPPQFKWSQYGGGLVGRGHFVAGAPNTVAIKANLQAITNSGLSSFYLEAVDYDKDLGHWRVTYGAPASLNNDLLKLGATVFGTIPSNPQPTDTTFFRLWNDIARVQDFPHTQLPNNVGIFLDFEPPAGSKYVPGDYWTFSVRAGEINNEEPLAGKDKGGGVFVGVPPKGIHYHRVPLAVLSWVSATNVQSPIEDCRHIFNPLTKLATCCSYRVGDGKESWGDFDRIQDAINSLPPRGGEICVLPGEYKENLTIKAGSKNITIKGCGKRSRIVAVTDDPVIHVTESQDIEIESLAIFASKKGIGVLLEGPDMKGGQGGTLRDITLENLYLEAATRCAIEAHVGFGVTIRGCDIEMSDEPSDAPGIFLTGDDSLIEHNIIRVLAAKASLVGGVFGGRPLDPDLFQPAHQGKGGLQIGGTSDRVRVINNLIQGGVGNGITLGSLATTTDGLTFTVFLPGSVGIIDPCDPCKDVDHSQPPPIGGGGNTKIVSAGALHEIYIERNLIYNMGSNGIGVVLFFDLAQQDEFISVDHLTIAGNEIRHCLTRRVADIPQKLINSMGYGGIALADVDYLVVHDNIIENNGPSHLLPICGIFVLHGEGLEISRNRILNNGANDGQPAQGARPGPRGGIYIVYGIVPRVPVIPDQKVHIPAQNGVPAIKVHDNIVSAPLGQALALTALGPVSVVGNQFTTQGVIVRGDSSTFWAATVLIFNLGLSNELYFQLLAFMALALGQIKSKNNYVVQGDTLVSPRPGLDDETLGQYLANGNVLFTNNQCVLDLMDEIRELVVSSVLIASLDDIGFHNNQCDSDLFLGDFVFVQAILFGMSVRATDNRFKEGLFGAWLSAMTFGLLNMTTNNQSTHCLLIRGGLVVDQPNTVLISGANPQICAPFSRVKQNFGKSSGG